MMINHEKKLLAHFKNIKKLGWIETKRHGDQMLGNALEDLLEVKENNQNEADWNNIELKTHRNTTNSPVSLFTKSPTHPKSINSQLRVKYGVSDNEHGLPKLNTRVKGDSFNTHRGGFGFKLDINVNEKRIYLLVKNLSNNQIVENEIYWDFDVIENAIKNKIKKIAVFYGDAKRENNKNFVRYTKMVMITGLTIENMLKALVSGNLYLELRLGVYSSGKKYGKFHDHGSGFRMGLNKLIELGEKLES